MGEKYDESDYGQFVQVNGLKMYYEEHGQGYPVILLHGGLGTGRSWSLHIPHFSQHFRVIVPDNRGLGKTDNPLQKLSYKLGSEDTIAFANKLNLTKPFICGWSDGGQIALEIGVNFPDFAKAIVVGGSVSKISDFYVHGLKEICINGPGDVNISVLQEKLPDLVKNLGTLHSSVYGPDYWKKLLVQISHMWLNPSEFLGEKIRKINIPCLLVVGDRDDVIPFGENIEMYRKIANSELCILPNTNHTDIYHSKSELFSSIVIDFIKRNLV